ncbi:hypothetical protein VQ056_11760 [Paenibacillus sp. JTLBN-2024]
MEYVAPGEDATITVGITAETGFVGLPACPGTDRPGGAVCAARRSHHPHTLHAETEFDAAYSDATLKVSAGMALEEAMQGEIELQLTDPDGNDVPIEPGAISLTRRSAGSVDPNPSRKTREMGCRASAAVQLKATAPKQTANPCKP